MKRKSVKKSNYYWSLFNRMVEASKFYPEGTNQWCEINKVGWQILEKYIEFLEQDFLK